MSAPRPLALVTGVPAASAGLWRALAQAGFDIAATDLVETRRRARRRRSSRPRRARGVF